LRSPFSEGLHTWASKQETLCDLNCAIIWVLSYIKATAVTREYEGPERQWRRTRPETEPDSTGNYRVAFPPPAGTESSHPFNW